MKGDFLGDDKLLGIVMENILSNAVVYARDKGMIKITVEKIDEEIKISVKDNGIGISEADQGRVFQKMFRGSNAKAVYPSGTGLGLYVVKRIVSQSGGNVWFESKENEGTTVFVTYPVKGMIKRKGEILI